MRVRAKQLIGQILVGESCDKAAGWNCGCYYWTPRCKLERAAMALGFKSRYRYASDPADAMDLVIINFAGSICIYGGKQMDQSKFDRELARIGAMSESQGKNAWPSSGFTNDYWRADPRAALRAAAAQRFSGRLLDADEEPTQLRRGDILLSVRGGLINIPDGMLMDREKFERELARITSAGESVKNKTWSATGSHADYWRVPAETIIKIAKNLGFEARLVHVSATGHSPVNLMLASFDGPVIIANGQKMDREKFEREVTRLSAVSESTTDYGFPQTGAWAVLPRTIRLYSGASGVHVHAALKNMGITPIRPDPVEGTPRRIIELTYYSIGIPDDAAFDFSRFARELVRARSSSE